MTLAAVARPESSEMSGRLLDLAGKAAELRISISHLRRLVAAGRIEAIDLTVPGSKRRTLRFKPGAP